MQVVIKDATESTRRITTMSELLHKLQEWARKENDLVSVELLERLTKRVESKELTEDDLPIRQLYEAIKREVKNPSAANILLVRFLIVLENYEDRKIRKMLHQEVARRRDLQSRLQTEQQETVRKGDTIGFLAIKRDLKLLEKTPSTTRQVDPETVELAVRALRIKEKHRNWSYTRIATEMFGDPSEAERIKKAVQRARASLRKAKKF